MKPHILRQAKAIVYFRMLRSVGCFYPIKGTNHFVFRHCKCCAQKTESIPNGLPEPVLDLSLKEIVKEYSNDLGPLCQEMMGGA